MYYYVVKDRYHKMGRKTKNTASDKLLSSTHRGDFIFIKSFINENPSFDLSKIRYEDGDSMLHVAARLGYLEVITLLLESPIPIDVDIRNANNKTPLHEAAQNCQEKAVKALLEYGADVNALKKADWTPLMLACTKIEDSSRNFSVCKYLVQNGAVLNYKNKDGWTPLHLLCREGSLHILDYLVTTGLHTKDLTNNGRSALHIACLHGHLKIVEYLLAHNLDIEAKDKCGNTSFHEASLGNHFDILQCLVEKGADKLARNNEGFIALHLCAAKGMDKMVEFLHIHMRIPLDVRNDFNVTPLHLTGKNKHKTLFNFIVNLGAQSDIKDSFGRTALDYLLA